MPKHTFSTDTREKVLEKYWHECANNKHKKCKGRMGMTFHHVVENTIVNEKLYGKENIQSTENALPLCVWCHDNRLQIPWIADKKKELINKWEKEKEILESLRLLEPVVSQPTVSIKDTKKSKKRSTSAKKRK